ncbi:4-hydroxy-tetrahydrodipicolinate reductase [Roseivirga misakiensis]|uniref:4-hydroxy-tetrahydrodipicolinate reductase n=1 Tax=Roseivirga misakiensis TaxID=1563681 RepID=A0A1E5T1E6_9BACT|nr:4-hydroxy-tetrahydrodipicolinate reductase [Roseivirga misakiensis]OEK05185.1 4-hydroxy-tetrahydrodipicolinate reductase [Roseivirga misakiensis]
MNILLIGYGKMGQLIDKLATDAGHQIVGKITIDNTADLQTLDTEAVDVAIEFSQPEAAIDNIKWCIDHQIPVAVGTTGWLDRKQEVDEYCELNNGTYLVASNFSIGVNLFFKLNEQLAKLMNSQSQYAVSTKEIHHTHKLDAPSGTSISIANGIIDHLDRKTSWVNEETDVPTELTIISERIDPAPGTHEISYTSSVDTIDIRHTAHSREGFAKGAIAVAAWLKDQKGVKSMEDFLNQV